MTTEEAAQSAFEKHWEKEIPQANYVESERETVEFSYVAGFYKGFIHATDRLGDCFGGFDKKPKPGKPRPYIGVTGFKMMVQVRGVNQFLDAIKHPQYVMYGVVSSSKRLREIRSEGKASPPAIRLHELLSAVHKDHLPMIHYHTNNVPKLPEELDILFGLNDAWPGFRGAIYPEVCNAVQLNLAWPDPAILEKVLASMPKLQIVLQLPASVLQVSDAEIVKRAKEYDGLVQYMLIDPSGGEGKDMDTERGGELLFALDDNLEKVTVGIAGGLCADTVARKVYEVYLEVDTRAKEHTHPFCIDAQGKLHTNALLDVEKVKRYLTAAFTTFDLNS